MADEDVGAVVAELQKVRQEHDALLRTILADAGMSVATRQVLLTHLRDEEQEHIDTIESLVGGGVAPRPSDAGGAPAGGGLTVGSLRETSAGAEASPTRRGTVGSLRPD